MSEALNLNYQTSISDDLHGSRLDVALAAAFPEHSRARLAKWVKSGFVRVNGQVVDKPREKVDAGFEIKIDAQAASGTDLGEAIPMNIVYEDEAFLIVNKQAGLVVHPASGNPTGTLLNAILHHCPGNTHLPRAGLVHRLDKDTTGLMVVAKTLAAHTRLVSLLQDRLIKREYWAVIQGIIEEPQIIRTQMGRHPKNRLKMAVVPGKDAVTHLKPLKQFQKHTLLELKLETGRTHQIRVHMAHINHPILGDQLYGNQIRYPQDCTRELKSCLDNFKRQALHAKRLSFAHPSTGKLMSFEAPIPADFEQLVTLLDAF